MLGKKEKRGKITRTCYEILIKDLLEYANDEAQRENEEKNENV